MIKKLDINIINFMLVKKLSQNNRFYKNFENLENLLQLHILLG